jgi:hypothetical protein
VQLSTRHTDDISDLLLRHASGTPVLADLLPNGSVRRKIFLHF